MGSTPDDLADNQQSDNQQQQQLPPEALHQELQKVRIEAAKYRTQNRDLRKLLSTLSGDELPEGQAPPALPTLQQRVEKMGAEHKAEVRTLKIQKQLIAASAKRGIEDADYLEYQLGRSGQLDGLDPDAEGFADDLDERVAELLVNRPELRGRQRDIPITTGAQFRPGPASNQISRSDLANMTPEEIDAARRSGQLNAILGRS
jgi:hypothetical protein